MVFFSMEVYGAKSRANVTTGDGNCGCYESGRFWLCHGFATKSQHFTSTLPLTLFTNQLN